MTDTLLVFFTGVLALAILMQSILLLLAYLGIRRLGKELLPQIQKLTKETEATFITITNIAENIIPAARKLSDSAEIIHARVVDVDGFVGEIVEKSRREIASIEGALHDVTLRARDAINILSDNILTPINRINALTRAIRVAAGVLFRRREKMDAPASSSGDNAIFF